MLDFKEGSGKWGNVEYTYESSIRVMGHADDYDL